MCEYCGCRQVEPIAELMDEHFALIDDGHLLRKAMASGDRDGALAHLRVLVDHLDRHVRKEERGIFAALRARGEFVDEVQQLEDEHAAFDAAIAGLDPDGPDFERVVATLLLELDEHIERENLGIFPVSVVSLGSSGWAMVEQARQDVPTFLSEDRPTDAAVASTTGERP